jgi:hypothetical protein
MPTSREGRHRCGGNALTQEQKDDPDMHWHKNDQDIVYTGINVSMFFAFLRVKKTKANG